MAQVINTNIASLNAQRNLNSSQAGTNQALERLSSGLRINSAKDDAAGLAISTRFESQIKGLNVAIRNAGDGVSLAQTAEGSLGSMTESLQRIRELALQASNGTNSTADREALNAEAQLLIEEVSRVSEGANFNGVNLLDGSLSTSFQVGANAGESIGVSIGKLTADTLGVSAKSGVSATSTDSALSGGDLVLNGVTVGASRASDDSSSTANASASAIAKAEAINRVSAESGVTALVDENVAAGTEMTASALAGSITINGTEIAIETTADAASSRSAVVTAINAQSSLTGVTAIDTGDDALGVSLVAEDGRNIELDLSTSGALTAAATGLAASDTYTGGVTLVANSGTNSIEVAGSNVANAGLTAGTFTAGVATVSSTSQVAAQATPATAGEVAGSTDISTFAFDFSSTDQVAEVAGTTDISGAFPLDLTNASSQDIQFTIDLDGQQDTITLDGTFNTDTDLLTAINGQIANTDVTASVVGGVLTFTQGTATTGTLEINDTGVASDSIDTAFGALNGATDTGTVDTSASFDVEVDDNGTIQTVNLTTNIANSADLLTAINGQLTGAEATIDGTTGFLTITSDTTGETSIIETSNAAGESAQIGFVAATGTGTNIGADNFSNLEAGDMTINDVNIGAARASDDTASYDGAASSSKEASGISIAAAINRSTDSTGVTATVNATTTVGATATAGTEGQTGTLYINGVDIGLTTQENADSNRAFAVSQINAASGQTGVIAEDNGTSVTLTAADGRNISLAMDTQGGSTSANFGLGGVADADFSDGGATGLTRANTEATTTYSTVTLSSAGTIDLSGGTNGNDDLADLGFQKGEFGGGVSGQFLNEVDISTQKGATEALAAIDNALNSVNSARADLGAVQNRFEATISNLAINSENLSAANSRIRDADFAAEAANLARSQVLQQAGISILSQANASGQQVLSLLQ
ncbi:MAG: flagellin [Pseudohongiella sp.]|uniref:flagellin N-terminal helical domain-containing protein n=1 Tax=Pseudohongiella sp. TaxID=1979412 RepID=UPI0034A0A305